MLFLLVCAGCWPTYVMASDSVADAVGSVMSDPARVDALEEDMVSLVRDLRSARHARQQQAETPAVTAAPPFPHAAASEALPATSQPTSALQAVAATRWMSTSGISAATPVARSGAAGRSGGGGGSSCGAGSKRREALPSSSASAAPPPSTPRLAGAACTTASRTIGTAARRSVGGACVSTPAGGGSGARGFASTRHQAERACCKQRRRCAARLHPLPSRHPPPRPRPPHLLTASLGRAPRRVRLLEVGV